ncbi:MAG: cytochrome c [Acidobacteriota bacterium]|nr:cytochrome c [Acidobacteriota bacterium]
MSPAVVVVAMMLSAVVPGDESPEEQGKFLYEVYCLNCHGENATGDGPTAKVLKITPTDLTEISIRNGGEFPTEEMHEIIDGRDRVRGHGRSQMPIWGLAFQDVGTDSDQEAEVRLKIEQLLAYLESIQKKKDD